MSIYDQAKNIHRTKGVIKCKCGSTRIKATILNHEEIKDRYDETWLELRCKACLNVLFYNGA